ncbi:D-alanyl-D-alanine carboxypeptidase family protein [Clostridium sp. BJN0001]|uniref:D-alanyl-D-alanine carboxypeptidase family protein n=1 Tax=Clostridium sp. BJN0001 TaxID=2930219 RepID=UPI001FD4B462|nr:D-alanyl-D-alanine carboxypeptidase family protein [Clostridium sp. BJN0001]
MNRKTLIKQLALGLILTFTLPVKAVYAATNSSSNLPDIQAEAALAMDYETGEVIYEKDGDSKRYPASCTKLLTGLLLAENKSKTDDITFTDSAKQQPEYSININFMHNSMKVGDTMTADDVMKGLLLFSGNDTAYMIADNVGGSSDGFSDMMNEKAASLGATSSHFITANGLHDENHYTTAYDLSLITKAAFDNDWERSVMELKDTSIDVNDKKIMLENRNLTLGEDGNIAGKTGHTSQAGGCLAAVYERDGRKIVGIILKSKQIDNADMSKFNDMDKIMDYSFSAEKETYMPSNSVVSDIEVKYKPFIFFGPEKTLNAPVKVTQNVTYYKNNINDADSKIEYDNTSKSAWQLLGTKDIDLTYKTRNHEEKVSGTITVSFGQIFKDNLITYLAVIVAIIIILSLIFMLSSLIRNRKRRNNRRRYNYSRRRY